MIISNRFFQNIYNLTKKVKRINLEIQKLLNENIKFKEFNIKFKKFRFYKNLIEKNLSK